MPAVKSVLRSNVITVPKAAVQEKNGDNYKVKQIDKLKALTSLEFIQNKYSNDNSKKNIESIKS